MKTLYIIRHAKSSWSFPELNDHDRPLGKRGRRNVINMAKHLAAHELPPHQIISSTASRALNTALFMADKWKYEESKIELESRLYHADKSEILSVIKDKAKHNVVAIFGHNPGMTAFANFFLPEPIDNLPTCGALGFRFDIPTWPDLQPHTADISFFYTPKKIENE